VNAAGTPAFIGLLHCHFYCHLYRAFEAFKAVGASGVN
jgi:hypothetical protein